MLSALLGLTTRSPGCISNANRVGTPAPPNWYCARLRVRVLRDQGSLQRLPITTKPTKAPDHVPPDAYEATGDEVDVG